MLYLKLYIINIFMFWSNCSVSFTKIKPDISSIGLFLFLKVIYVFMVQTSINCPVVETRFPTLNLSGRKDVMGSIWSMTSFVVDSFSLPGYKHARSQISSSRSLRLPPPCTEWSADLRVFVHSAQFWPNKPPSPRTYHNQSPCYSLLISSTNANEFGCGGRGA